MRTKNLLSGICAVSFAALSLVGCSDYDNGYTEQQIQFIQNFKDIYGEVDPTQDWNLAERGTVTVTVSKPSNVQIYAKANDKYRIVGDYEDISGTQTLGFDMVEGTTDIMVSDGHTAQKTIVGESVTFAGTRTIYSTDYTKFTKKTDTYLELPQADYLGWSDYVPEKKFNLGKVTQDFVFVSTGEFTIYPIYWNTSNSNELGIYTLDDNGDPVETAIYHIGLSDFTDADGVLHTGDPNELEYWKIDGYKDDNDVFHKTKEYWESANGSPTPYTVDKDIDGNIVPNGEEIPSGEKKGQISQTPTKIHAKGITVNLPVGTLFGMYLNENATSADGKKFYSNSRRNDKYYGLTYTMDYETGEVDCSSIVNDPSKNACYACTFTNRGRLYLGFEDWAYQEIPYGYGYTESDVYKEGNTKYTDFDLNDCMFVFGDDTPDVIDLDALKWVISAEDLGDTHDIDYNDVVIEVAHTSGQRNAYVTPLAAGGTLASFVYFGDTPVGSADYGKSGEIHELFSSRYAQTTSGDYEPINVGSDKQQVYSTRNYTIEVGRNWSLASNVPDYETTKDDGTTETFDPEKAKTMGGFNIRVVPYGKEVTAANANGADAQRIQNNTDPSSNAPFVICTLKYWTREDRSQKGHYRWPQESVHMYTAYADNNVGENEKQEGTHTFEAWVKDKTDPNGKIWYQYPNAQNTCAPFALGINPEESFRDNSGSEGGTGGGSSNVKTISIETFETGQSKVLSTDEWNNEDKIENASFINLTSFEIPSGYKTGTLTVKCNEKPNQTVFWLYNDGTVIKDDDYDGWNNETLSLSLSYDQLQTAKTTGGIYIATKYDRTTTKVEAIEVTLSYEE